MENEYRVNNTFDRTVFSLCLEIDGLKEDVKYWKQMYDDEFKRNNDMVNNNLKNAQQDLANVFAFALAVRDDKDGNLVIDKDDRKILAERLKENRSEVDVEDIIFD